MHSDPAAVPPPAVAPEGLAPGVVRLGRAHVEFPEDFLSQLSHEMKNHLAGAQASLFLLRQHGKDFNGERERGWLASCDRTIAGLRQLVERLEELQRVLFEPLPPREPIVDLRDWLADLAKDARRAFPASVGPLDIRVETGPGRWQCTPALTGVALEHLLGNAFKFGPAEGAVQLSVRATERGLWFGIADSGPGVLPEEVSQLGKPFFQASSGRGGPGVGLGLTIAKAAAGRIGGRVSYRRNAGERTEFHLEVPARAVPSGAAGA